MWSLHIERQTWVTALAKILNAINILERLRCNGPQSTFLFNFNHFWFSWDEVDAQRSCGTNKFLNIFIWCRTWTSGFPGCGRWSVLLPNTGCFHALLCDWLLLSINWEKPCLSFFSTGHVWVISVLSHLVENVTGSGNCQHFPYGSFNSSQKAVLPRLPFLPF